MNLCKVILRGTAAAVAIPTLAVFFIGFGVQIVSGQGLLTNGDFGSDLTGWKMEGSVMASDGVATLVEGANAPVLYQPVAVSGYVYELRFDLDLSGLSASAGSGQLDRARLLLYLGTDAATLTPDEAVDEALLIEADVSGLLWVAENAQVVANAALGEGWYSAVVEVISDFEAIAPAGRLIDGNGSADSSMGIDNLSLKALDRGRFANISNRGGVGTGASIMIPGFVIEGPTNKSLVIRGVGPTLGELGVPGTLSDPRLKLYYKPPGQPAPADELKAENDNWEEASDVDALKTAMKAVGAFDLTEGNLDAALLAADLVPGAYTVQVSGVNAATGVALAEVYDMGASADGPTELVNISNRGFIGTGASVQIPGFVIRGTRGRVVLARAVGPTLGGFGVAGTIEDPTLKLYDQSASATPLYTNDNWEDAVNTTEVKATAARVGAFPLGAGSKDAAILASLPPGSYTAVARGVDGATGVALVEVYVVTDNRRPTAESDSQIVASTVEAVLPMDEILGNDTDPENDVLSVGLFTQPDEGTITMNDEGELVYTSPAGFFGETIFSYRASDGEYESIPATVALQVRLEGTLVWQGSSSDDFSDPANWVGGVAPGANDSVWIAPEGGGTVLINADTEVGSLWVGDSDSAVTLRMNGKNLTVSGGVKVQPGSTFEFKGGTLDTTQDVVIGGTLDWTSGVMNGAGTTIIETGASAMLHLSPKYLRGGRDFLNKGTVTQSGRGTLRSDTAGASTTITNAAGAQWTSQMSAGHNIAHPNNATATMDFLNAGTLIKNGGSANLGGTNGTFNLTNTGTIEVAAGTLQLFCSAIPDLSGSIVQGDGTKLRLLGGTLTLNGTLAHGTGSLLEIESGATLIIPSGKELTDMGKVKVNGGTTLILHESHTLPDLESDGGTLDLRSTLSVGTLKFTGTILCPEDITITGTLDWDSGVMNGAGTTIIETGASAMLHLSPLYLRGGRDFLNKGTLTQRHRGTLRSDTAGASTTITNAVGAQWTSQMAAGHNIAHPNNATATMEFLNAGTLIKNGGSANLGGTNGTFNLTNTGTIAVAAGTLQVYGTTATLGASGTLRLVTNGSTKPIVRNGDLTIAGTLEVILADGYAPANGTVVRLIDYTSKSGAFSTVTPPQGRAIAEAYQSDGLDVTIN